MLTLKILHVFCAYATGMGFLLRGVLVIFDNPARHHRLTKTLPHVIDTCLMFSGLFMVLYWNISPVTEHWLLAKLVALFFYIGFGLVMIRWGSTEFRRRVGLLGGVFIYCYIVGVAHSKSVLSIFSFL
jgi:uncharacterized membrane protein SirB2